MRHTYEQFARELVATQILSDPWLSGQERFRLRAVMLEPERARALVVAADEVAELHDELAAMVWKEPALLDSYFGLTPWQKLMWLGSGGAWHGIARADLFFCKDGSVRCCELNSDTPSGEAEAVLINRILRAEHGEESAIVDPNAGLADRFIGMVRKAHGTRELRTVGIIYPTELTEDLSMIALYRSWLEGAGLEVVLGSPFNVVALPDGSISVLGRRVDLILRHYKTDWWGEREPAWLDAEGFVDAEPLERQLTALLDAQLRGLVTIVNPFGAVLTQNKLSLAFFHEERARFSPRSQERIDALIPETRRLPMLDRERLISERALWVLKSDFGCEGTETLCGAWTTPAEWVRALDLAVSPRWVAQRFFEVAPDGDGLLPNVGVFVVGGRAAGFFTRLSRTATDFDAVTAPTFVLSRAAEP